MTSVIFKGCKLLERVYEVVLKLHMNKTSKNSKTAFPNSGNTAIIACPDRNDGHYWYLALLRTQTTLNRASNPVLTYIFPTPSSSIPNKCNLEKLHGTVLQLLNPPNEYDLDFSSQHNYIITNSIPSTWQRYKLR